MVKADDGSTNTQTFDNEGFDALDVGTMKENGGAFNGISAKEPESKEVEDVIEPETKKSKLDLDIEDGKSNDHEENVNFQMTLWKVNFLFPIKYLNTADHSHPKCNA
eukprot:XP_011670075.1 PREDICTED: uncharacterized protein LOC105441037 [Strongylocentrotus purpuratus]